jgi:hypothetical protein
MTPVLGSKKEILANMRFINSMLLFTLLVLLSVPSWAGVTLLGSNSYAEGGTSGSTLIMGIGCIPGNLLRVTFADRVGGPIPTIADSKNNSWKLLAGPTTNTVRKTEWYAVVTRGGLLSIKISFTVSKASRAAVVAVFDGTSTSPLDANPADSTGNTSPFNAPSSGLLAQANEVVTGGFALAGSTDDTIATSPDTSLLSIRSNSITRVDSASGSGGGDSLSTTVVTGALTTLVGDLIVLVGADQIGEGSFTLTDSLGNTVNSLNGGTNGVRMTAAYIVVAPGKSGPTIYTGTFSSSSKYRSLLAVQYRGLTATPLDVNPAAGNTNTTAPSSPSSGTLAQQKELVVSMYAEKGNDSWNANSNMNRMDQKLSGGNMTIGVGAVIGTQMVQSTTPSTESIACGTPFLGVSGIASFKGLPSEESIAAMTYHIVSSTTAVAPQITDTANRASVMGTSTFKAASVP